MFRQKRYYINRFSWPRLSESALGVENVSSVAGVQGDFLKTPLNHYYLKKAGA